MGGGSGGGGGGRGRVGGGGEVGGGGGVGGGWGAPFRIFNALACMSRRPYHPVIAVCPIFHIRGPPP